MVTDTNEYPLRDRLRDLDTKAYYLLVALSFIYTKNVASASLKWALILTALVAVLPLQDVFTSTRLLQIIHWFKVVTLVAALLFTIHSLRTP